MKKTIGFVAAGYLAVTVGAQGIFNHQQMAQQEALSNKEIAVMQQASMQLQKRAYDAADAAAKLKAEVPNAASADRDSIMEEFKITKIDDKGYVHGEPITGVGEGIYYSIETFKQMGAGNVKVGDTVDVTWPISSYEDDNWDNIKKIEIEL